jgi:hypothetical protein
MGARLLPDASQDLQREQLSQLRILVDIEHRMLGTRGYQKVLVGVSHRVDAGAKPILGSANTWFAAQHALLQQIPGRCYVDGVHETVHHECHRPAAISQNFERPTGPSKQAQTVADADTHRFRMTNCGPDDARGGDPDRNPT